MSDELTTADVERILRRAEKATPGPYRASKALDAEDMEDGKPGWWVKHDGWLDEGDGLYFSRDDAVFYANSQSDVCRLALSWLEQRKRIPELTAPLQRTRPVIVNDGDGEQYACPSCGGTNLKYEEDYGTDRTMVENNAADKVIAFDGDFEWYEGDSTPGVVCAELSCRTVIDMEGIEEDFR